MLELFAVSGLVVGVIALAFGLIVILKNWKDVSNRLFLLMAIALGIWALSYWRWLSASDEATALLWIQLLAAASVLIPTLFLEWTLTILGQSHRFYVFRTFIHISAVAVILLSRTQYVIADIRPKLIFPFWPDAGPAYTFYLFIIYSGCLILALHLLFSELKNHSSSKRGQAVYILIGALFGFGGGFSNFLLWYDIPVLPYGNILVAVFPFLLSYAALKHRLFNLRALSTELLVTFINVVLLIQVGLSDGTLELFFRSVFFIAVAVASVVLIKAEYREVEQRERIEQLSNDKSEFMTFASHEIRNPITRIQNFATLLLEGDAGTLDTAAKGTVEKIQVSTHDVLSLITQFLNKSKLELGQLQYSLTSFDVGSCAATVVGEFQPHASQRGLKLISHIDLSKDYCVLGDAQKVKEVIGIFIDNSLKYTKEGSVTVSVEQHTGDTFTVAITDTGVGIPAETIPNLFKKFSRADAEKANLLGTGVGLYLAKNLIEGMRGRVWVESPGAGKGSTFFIQLPAAH